MIEFTPWFQPMQPPVRKGLYLIKVSATAGCQQPFNNCDASFVIN